MSHIEREIGVARAKPRAKANGRQHSGRPQQAPYLFGFQRADFPHYTRLRPEPFRRRTIRPARHAPFVKLHNAQLIHDAIYGLDERYQEQSARSGLSRKQTLVLVSILGLSITGAFVNWIAFAIVLNVMALTLATILLALRVLLLDAKEDSGVIDPAHFPSVTDDDLPIYTLLVPLLREADVLPGLIQALKTLDYPKDKLDIKLILEEDDEDTIKAVRTLPLADLF